MKNPVEPQARRAVAAAALISLAATLLFVAAFQLSKTPAISDISPFAEDPADAVASIAFQVALAGSLIAVVRWARLAGDPGFSPDRARLVLPGCELAAAAIAVTVITDVAALLLAPLPGISPWEGVLVGGLVVVGAGGAAAGVAILTAVLALRSLPSGESLSARRTLADLIEDGLVVVGRMAGWIGPRYPPLGLLLEKSSRRSQRVWGWVNRSWISPRRHPWRFVASVGLMCGLWLLAAKFLLEGESSSPVTALLVFAIFLGVELAAVLGGYLVFGGWLGIRPPVRRDGIS